MEKFKFNRFNTELTEKQLNMSMLVDSSAAYVPEITEFYVKALVDKTDANLFLNVPRNKATKRIPRLSTGRVIQPFNCSWNGKDIDLDAKEVSVDKVSAMTQICISDIEDSFEVWNMTQGANNPVNPQTLLNFIWGEIARAVRADFEYLRWYGDKSVVDVDSFTDRSNGYITLIKSNLGLVNLVPTATTITPSNVVDEFYSALSLVKPEHRKDSSTLSVFVASNVYLAFAVAASTGNTSATHLVADSGDMFIGKYKITEVATLEDNVMVMVPKQDIIYTYDLENENFITVDRLASAAEPTIRFRVNLYFGQDFYDYTNVVYYDPNTLTS
jgi:hypothetical protein